MGVIRGELIRSLTDHARALLGLSVPIAVAQLSQVAMGVTDLILLGSLGPRQIAAGGLGTSLFFTVLIMLQGVLTSVSMLIAQARGGGTAARIPSLYRSGIVLALTLSLLVFAVMSAAQPLLLALGEAAELASDAGAYARVLRWGAPAAMLGIGLMRAFLPAIGRPRILLWVSLVATVCNGFLNYALIHGAWGMPRLGLLGSATATVLTLWLSTAALFSYTHLRRSIRPSIFPGRASARIVVEMTLLGWPVAVTYGVEVALFLAVGLSMGLIGPNALAAHQIALSLTSATFMVPLAIGQAANVRVGIWAGARQLAEARRAAWVALALGTLFMVTTGIVFITGARIIVGFYLDPAAPGNARTIAIAVSLLAVAALFQVVDGIQVIASGSLRGLKDTRAPMLIAALCYWGVGFGTGQVLAFYTRLGAAGLWLGLAAGLATAAVTLTWRFERISRRAAAPP